MLKLGVCFYYLDGGGGNRQHMSQRDSAAVCRDTEELKGEEKITLV